MGCGVLRPSTIATPLVLRQHLISLLKVGDHLCEGLVLRGTCIVLLDRTVGRLQLQHDTTILTEQTVEVVAAQEVSLTEGLVTAVLIGHVHSLRDHQVGGSDTIVHLIPKCRYGRAVLVGCTQGWCTVQWIQTIIVSIPGLRGEVGTIGELITTIERDTVCPLITEVPADVSIESGSHLQGSSLVFQQRVSHLMACVLFQELIATGGRTQQSQHRQCTAN